MSRPTGTQHKPSRDDRKAKELAEVKRENGHLKKQVSRLRAQLKKLVETHGLDTPGDDYEEESVSAAPVPPSGPVCEKCGGTELTEVSGNNKVFLICKNKSCLWRKIVAEQ